MLIMGACLALVALILAAGFGHSVANVDGLSDRQALPVVVLILTLQVAAMMLSYWSGAA